MMTSTTEARNARKFRQKQRRSDAWVAVIANAGAQAATVRTEDQLTHQIAYLISLRHYLESQRHNWHRVPGRLPPKMIVADQGEEEQAVSNPNTFATVNPYAAFEDQEDEDSESLSSLSVEEKDGETTSTNPQQAPLSLPTTLLTMRRLYIRVLTTSSELHVVITNIQKQERDDRYWTQGVDAYATAVHCLQVALGIAEEESSRLLQGEWEGHAERLHQAKEQLAQDAHVVLIATNYYAQEREHFLEAADRRRRYLQRKLTPQWHDRDEIKEKLGYERWTNNPHPKNDYAQLRVQQEQELRAIETAISRLDALQSDLEQAHQRSESIYQSAAASGYGADVATAGEDAKTLDNDDDNLPNDIRQQQNQPPPNRYNGIRPANGLRVSLHDYPDPTRFGWTFTGSAEASLVEFFEKTMMDGLVVKLDWYYTTGTIKTSMDHPTQGPNQLFGKQVTPSEYLQILQNPRAHTSVRYRTRDQQKSRGERGRGGRGRGRGGRGRGRGRRSSRGRGRGSDRGRGRVPQQAADL